MNVIDNLEKSIRSLVDTNTRLNDECGRQGRENERLRAELREARETIGRLRMETEQGRSGPDGDNELDQKKRDIADKIKHIISQLDTLNHIDTETFTNRD